MKGEIGTDEKPVKVATELPAWWIGSGGQLLFRSRKNVLSHHAAELGVADYSDAEFRARHGVDFFGTGSIPEFRAQAIRSKRSGTASRAIEFDSRRRECASFVKCGIVWQV